MNRARKWWIAVAGGLALAGILGAGAVMAQTPVPGTSTTGTSFLSRVAQKLGIDTPTLENAVKGAKTDEVDARVASGDLTQAQADQIKQRIANEPAGAFGFGSGPGDRGPGHGRGGFADPQKLATFLGITADQLRTETGASGATLATVAQAHGKSRDELKAFLTTEMKSRVDQEVANGELTQAQADTKLADMTSKLDQMIDGTGHPGHGPDYGMRGFRGLPPVAPDASPSPAASNNG
jgi:uncharacterized protein YidB (DUF937 family)